MKTASYILLLLCSVLFSLQTFASGGSGGGVVPPPPGMPPCAVNPAPGQTACNATPICNVHGFCGTTSSSYTADYWSQLNGAFCGSIENNAFLTFTAEASTISFDTYVYNCPSGDGIQVFIFDAANCGSGPVTGLVCVNQMYAQNTPYNVTANGLTPGNQYYIMIDGYAGDVCDYTFVATAGVALPLGLDIGNNVNLCSGETIVATPYGGDGTYTWDPSPDLTVNPANGAATILPPTTPGTYTYTLHSQGGVPNCPQNTSYTLTLNVDACCMITTSVPSVNCDVANGVYSANVEVTFSNPPPTGTLQIYGPNGLHQTVNTPFGSSPYTTTIPGVSLSNPTGNFTAYFSDNLNCTHVLTYNAPQVPTFTPITICQGDQAPALPATSIEGHPGTWAPATINNNATATYTFTPSNGQCSTDFTVTVNPSPAVNATSPVIYDCTTPGGVQLSASSDPGNTYSWTDELGGNAGIVSGENTDVVTVNSVGDYIVTVTNPTTSCVNTAIVTVTGNGSEPLVSIDPPADVNCYNQSTSLTGNATNSGGTQDDLIYQWSTGDGSFTSATDVLVTSIDGAGVYTLTVTDTINGCITSESVLVGGSLDKPVLTPISFEGISCPHPLDTLIGSSDALNAIYTWSTSDGTIVETQGEYASVSSAGTYTLTATNPDNGCVDSISVVISGNTILPHVEAGPDLALCPDGTVTLQGSSNTPGVTFSWDATNDGSVWLYGFSNIPNPEVPSTAWFYLNVTDPTNNCTATDSMQVTEHEPPVIFGDTSVCATSFQIPAGGVDVQGTFTWSELNNGGTFSDSSSATAIFTPTDPSIVNYTLILTDACSSDTAHVAIVPQPVVSSPSGLCDNPKILISVSYGTGTWSGTGVSFTTANTTSNNDLTVVTTTATAAPGTHTVTYTNNTVCNFSETITLVFPEPVSIFNDTTVCASSFQVPAGSVTANGAGEWSVSPAGSGTFSPSNNVLTPTFTPNTGVVNVTLTYSDSCTSDNAIVVFPPKPVVSTPPAYSCNDMHESIFTTSLGGGNWSVLDNPATSWHEDTAVTFAPSNVIPPGSNQTQTIVSSHPTHGNYTLVFTDQACGYTDTITLNFLPYPWTEINDTIVCNGVEHQLTAYNSPLDLKYEWSTGATGPSILVTQPGGVYYVEAYNDCYSYIDSAVVTYVVCDIDAPNVISLSSQAGNQIWYVDSYGIKEFKCVIVNRWGNLIYEFNDTNANWDGRDMSGNVVMEGVYFYTLEAVYNSGEEVKKHGFIHVVH